MYSKFFRQCTLQEMSRVTGWEDITTHSLSALCSSHMEPRLPHTNQPPLQMVGRWHRHSAVRPAPHAMHLRRLTPAVSVLGLTSYFGKKVLQVGVTDFGWWSTWAPQHNFILHFSKDLGRGRISFIKQSRHSKKDILVKTNKNDRKTLPERWQRKHQAMRTQRWGQQQIWRNRIALQRSKWLLATWWPPAPAPLQGLMKTHAQTYQLTHRSPKGDIPLASVLVQTRHWLFDNHR